MRNEAVSHRKFAPLFLFFLLNFLLFLFLRAFLSCVLALLPLLLVSLLALRFLVCRFPLRFLGGLLTLRCCIAFLNMPLSDDYPGLIVNNTDGVDWVTLLLFKFQSAFVRLSVNGQGTRSSW